MLAARNLNCTKYQPPCQQFNGVCPSYDPSCSLFDTACTNVSCTLFHQYLNGLLPLHIPIEHGANADIVGYGTLAGFFVTAAVAIVAVLFAYLSNALDDSSLNYIDRRIITATRNFWYQLRSHRKDRQMSRSSLVNLEETRKMRNEGLTQLVLSLSDQQLVTGLAVLLAGVLNQEYFSRYEFIVLHSLAWFSSTTHLATLDTLRYYFNRHRIIHKIRTIGISVFLILMAYCFFIRALIAMAGLGMEIPVACVYEMRVHISECSNWTGTFNEFWQGAWIIALLLILIGYLIRIQDFYTHQRHPFYIFHWLVWKMMHPRTKTPSHQRVFEERRAALRLRRLWAASDRKGLMRLLPVGYDDSYLSSIPEIIFSFSYGVTQIAAVRWGSYTPPTQPASVLGYGQTVTVLLLCLPFMAAGETISDFQFKRNQQLTDRIRQLSMSFDMAVNEAPDEFDDLPAIDAKYRSGVSRMKGFLSKEIHQIEDNESKRDYLETVRSKQLLLAHFEVVREFQNSIKVWPSIVWFAANVLGAIVSSVLLNVANFDNAGGANRRIIFAITIFLAYIGIKAVCLAGEIVAMFQIDGL